MTRNEPGTGSDMYGQTGQDESFDQRWARWQARGIEDASRTRRRMAAVAISVCAGGALWTWMSLAN